jgi:hypothetical protein
MRIDQYNLYLVRALASITESVSDPQQALNDLNLASFIRSGAVLPRMLTIFLEHRTQPQHLLEKLKEFLAGATPEAQRATGEFLLAFAGVCPPSASHMMRFPMGYASRKLLTTKALEWLGAEADGSDRSEWYHGLDYELALHAEKILVNLGDSRVLDAELLAGRQLLVRVSQQSKLLAWKYTFDLLADEDTTKDKLDAAMRLAGAIHYVRVVQHALPIDQAETNLRTFEPRLTALLEPADSSPDTSGNPLRILATELRARVSAWIGDQEDARKHADAWLKHDDRDPEAHLCKICALVRAHPKDEEEYFRVLRHVLDVQDNGVGLDGLRVRMRRRIEHAVPSISEAGAKAWTKKLLDSLAATGAPQ